MSPACAALSTGRSLEAELLAAEFGTAHPEYPRADWIIETATLDIDIDYWEWVIAKMQEDVARLG